MAKYYYGGAPADINDVPQLGQDDYHARGRAYAWAYASMIYRFLEKAGHPKDSLPSGFTIRVSSEPHDFGNYYDVIASFSDANPHADKCHELALLIDWSAPTEWDEEAKKELGIA